MNSAGARAPATEFSQHGLAELVFQFAKVNKCQEIVQGIQAHMLRSALDVPAACSVFRQTVQQKALLLRCGVQHSLVDRQKLAKFLASPVCQDLLQNYARLWEEEWRISWLPVLQTGESAAAGKDHRSSAHRFPMRLVRCSFPIGCVWHIGTPQEDKRNGNLVVNAMQSFFSMAIHMVHVEANEVLTLNKAFVKALVSDVSFLQCLSSSMRPKEERHQEYQTEEDSLLGLTYVTLLLQTDLHNRKVARKTWNRGKFMDAGKDIGFTPGVMLQIYKNVKKGSL